ncbi:MAG TPA: FHA domain-containing protein [Ardenticatenaceae bacterium]
MTQDLILVAVGAVIGFVLGVVTMLVLRERPSDRVWETTGAGRMELDDLSETVKQNQNDDTQDQRKLPESFVEAATGRATTAPTESLNNRGAPVAMLMAQGGTLDGRSWLLRYAASTTIGRFDDCDIAINDNGVSRLHAQITHRTDAATAHEFAIFDYSSTNGTMVNGQPINAVASLQDGDSISIGNTKFQFRRVRHE